MNATQWGHDRAARQRALIKGYLLLCYVLAVHLADSFATLNVRFAIDWDLFRWQGASGFDLFKFLAWFVLPLLFFFPGMDPHSFSFRRWRRRDLYLLAGLAAAGTAAVALIPLFPSLRETYPSMRHLPAQARWTYAEHHLVWLASWLVGWEFFHRYVLLFKLTQWWGPKAWILVPAIEGMYHVAQQKPLVECAAMVAFSIVLCQWALRRRNVLLPFLAHLVVEISLLAFLIWG